MGDFLPVDKVSTVSCEIAQPHVYSCSFLSFLGSLFLEDFNDDGAGFVFIVSVLQMQAVQFVLDLLFLGPDLLNLLFLQNQLIFQLLYFEVLGVHISWRLCVVGEWARREKVRYFSLIIWRHELVSYLPLKPVHIALWKHCLFLLFWITLRNRLTGWLLPRLSPFHFQLLIFK